MDKSRMIHKNDEITRRFYQVDKLLLENPKYEKLSDGAILTWSILRDRMELSKQNAEVFSDEEGYLFLIFTDEELAQILHRNRKTANARKKELERFGLLYNVRMGNQEANRLYLLEPEKCDPNEYLSNQFRKKKQAELVEKQIEKAKSQKKKYVMIEIIEDDETDYNQFESLGGVMMSQKRTSVMSKKRTSGRVKNGHPDVQDLGCNDTNVFNTDLNDTIIFDDDKKRTSPSGEDSPNQTNESINLIIRNFKEATKDEITDRSFKAVVRKVMDKHSQGKVASFRDYLATALANKIHELELRRAKSEAKDRLKAKSQEMIQEKKQQLEQQLIRNSVPFYNWLEE